MLVLQALDRVYDRCEETVLHTGRPILSWLRSRHRQQGYRLPFQLLGKSASRQHYRRIMKRFCTLIFRCRLDSTIRQQVMPRTLRPHQQELRGQIWVAAHQSLVARTARSRLDHESVLQSPKSTNVDRTESDYANDYASDADESGSNWSDDAPSMDESNHSEDETAANCDWHNDETVADSTRDSEETDPEDVLSELVFLFMSSFCLEEFKDGQPDSSLLVFFSGVLGFTSDGTTFRRARDYTSFLSALIHQQQLICLEYALPYRAYMYLKRPARPTSGQLRCLNQIRHRYMCLDSLAPVGEFYSLRDFGRKALRSEGPSFWVRWSDDGQTLFFA